MFCRYCGNKISDTAKFCKSCGKAIAKAEIVDQQSYKPQQNDYIIVKPNEINQKSPQKKYGFFKVFAPMISLALVGLLIFYFVGPFDLPWIDDFPSSKIHNNESAKQYLPRVEYSSSERSARADTAVISPTETKAELEGITVDFGKFNIAEEKTLEIVSLPIKTDDVAGVDFKAFDIKLGDEHEFNTLVDITMAYDPQGLTDEEQETAITVAWYDEETKNWTPLLSTVDVETKTISFSTDHFSLFGFLTNKENKGKSVFYYPDHEYKGVNTPILLDTGALMSLVDKVDTKPFQLLIRDRSVPTNDLLSTGASYLNIITGTADELEGASNLLLPSIMKVGETVGKKFALLGSAAVSLKMSDQLIRGVPITTILRDNAFNIVEMALIVAVTVKASPFLAAAATAMWVGGIVDELTYDPEDITSYLNVTERCYDHFSMRQVTYNTDTGTCSYIIPLPGKSNKLSSNEFMLSTQADWARVLKRIQKENEDSPQLIKEEVDKVVESYSLAFWRAYYDNNANLFSWLDQEKELLNGKLAITMDWPKSKDEVQKYVQRTIIRNHDRLQTVYKEMAKMENFQIGVQYVLAAKDLTEALNETIYFEAIDPTLEKPGFAKSTNSSKYIEIDSQGFNVSDFVAAERYNDSNIIFRCNLYHYLMAGSPTQVAVYPFAPSDTAMPLRDEYLAFSYNSPTIKIEFPPEVEDKEIYGHWSIYSTYSNNGWFGAPGLTAEESEIAAKEHGVTGEFEPRGFSMEFRPDNTFKGMFRSADSSINADISGTYKTIKNASGKFEYLADIEEELILNHGEVPFENYGDGPDLKFYFAEKDGILLLYEETTQIYLE